jgi:hypothetical protein
MLSVVGRNVVIRRITTCSVIGTAIVAVRSVINITDSRYTNTQIKHSEFVYNRINLHSTLEKNVECFYVQ